MESHEDLDEPVGFDGDDDVAEPSRPRGGWRAALARSQAPTHCAICGEALTNIRSQEVGIGPVCAQKYWRYYENPPLVSAESAESAMALLPDPAGARMRELGGDGAWRHDSEVRRAMVQSALWYGSYAASFGGDQRETVADKVDTGLLTISCVETLARAFGYDKVADRMVKKWGWEMQRNRIRFVDGPGGTLGVIAPYSPEFNEACRARRELFPKYEKRNDGFVRYFRAHDLSDVCNLISGAFGDGLAVNPQGNLTTLPAMALLAPPKPSPPAPPPSKATDEVEPYPPGTEFLQLGDEVNTPLGRSFIQYINPKRLSIGVGPQKGRGYTFFSFEQIETLNGKKIATELNAQRRVGAAQEGASAPSAVSLPANLPAGLMKHQVDCVAFVHTHGGRVLIADEMGLGKTGEAVASFSAPALVVCPATLKVNWAREVARWGPAGVSVAIIEGSHEPTPLQQAADVTIINYDILHTHAGWLAQRGFKWIVADEAHYLKNLDIRWDKKQKVMAPKAGSPRRAVAFYYVQERIPHMLLLTGTPILNRVKELFPLLHLLDPRVWKSGYDFCKKYCDGHEEFVGRKTIFRCDGRSNMPELHERLQPFMIRRLKNMLDLPEKQRRSMTVSLSDEGKKLYNRAANEFMKWLQELDAQSPTTDGPGRVERALRAGALTKLTALRHIVARGKAEAATEWIASYCESTGRPLLVMAIHDDVFDAMIEGVDKLNAEAGRPNAELSKPIRYAKIVGATPKPARQEAIDRFQGDDAKGIEPSLDLIFYSIKIAVGTTLTRAQDVLFVERDWVPGQNVQAEDRVHRLGQKNTVTITYLDAEGTIDQKIAMLLIDKTKTAAGVIDGMDLNEDEAANVVLGELLKPSTVGRGMKANPPKFVLADSWEQAL